MICVINIIKRDSSSIPPYFLYSNSDLNFSNTHVKLLKKKYFKLNGSLKFNLRPINHAKGQISTLLIHSIFKDYSCIRP